SCGVGLGLDASESFGTAPGGAAGHRRQAGMSMKTILVPTESHEPMRSALAAALALAQRFDSYIEGFALRFRVNEFIAVDMAGAIPLETPRGGGPRQSRGPPAGMATVLQEAGVPRGGGAARSLSFSRGRGAAPEGEDFVGSHGRVFDIIVMSRSEADSAGLHERAIESGLFDSGRPVLIAGPTPPAQIGVDVLVHWNCSTEQARATAFAM